MHSTKFKGAPCQLAGHLPPLHTKAPNFSLIDGSLHERSLHEFHGKKKLLATVPSLDTGVCSTMTKHCNTFAKKHPDFLFLLISADLPFAQKRFCEAEQVHNVLTLSMMRDKSFGESYGVLLLEGPLKGLLARALFVLDGKDHVIYEQLVAEITEEPNYHPAFEALLHG